MLCIPCSPWKPHPGRVTPPANTAPPSLLLLGDFYSQIKHPMCALMQSLQQPLNTLLALLSTNVSPAILICQWTASPNSSTVNNECFFHNYSRCWSYQGICRNWVIPTPPPMPNSSCPWLSQPFQPWGTGRWHSQGCSCRKPRAMLGAPTLQKSGTDLCRVWICTTPGENGSEICHCSSQWAVATFIDQTIQLMTQLIAIWFQQKCMWLTPLH